MENVSTDIVVIIAAGMGSRLRSDNGPPKPLCSINGRPLLLRVLDNFAKASVKEAVIVLGHRSDEIIQGVEQANHSAKTTFVYNPDYKKSNGLSVLAAKEAVGKRNFFLSMADHIFDFSLIQGLKRATLPEEGLVLAVDRKLDQIYDEDDATKVKTENGCIVEIGKEISSFDSVDTGLFLCTPILFEKIADVSKKRPDGDCSLSDGVWALANQRKAIVHDIGDGHWQDVDTPGALEHAAKNFG